MGDNFPGPNAGYVPVGTFVSADGKRRRKFGIEDPSRPASPALRAVGHGAALGHAAALDEVDAVLARFPGPVTLTGSRVKYLGVLAASVVFVAALAWMLQHGAVGPAGTAKAWLGVLFFGAGAVIGAVMLLPGASSLTLSAQGFERITLFVKRPTAWQQASGFIVGEYLTARRRQLRTVAYDDAACWGAGADLSRKLVGRNTALPDTYGLAHEDLARLMTQWRQRALAQPR